MKYIDEECKGCQDYISPYGCTYHGCIIYKEYQEGRAEEAADMEHERRKDARLDPVFDDMFRSMGLTK